jgi:hypothetical protein
MTGSIPDRACSALHCIILGSAMMIACASQPRPKAVESESQTYAQAIQQMCDVDALAGTATSDNEIERARLRENYIIQNTENSDAIFFSTVWRTKPPDEQSRLLAEEASIHGLMRCALADSLAANQ